ncbi:MAG: poly(3-hydroxybutyrate) depolymerase [Deltaproteobacteria bacterium]|nr:MAG: poly(3-hydroxybutyrate) depolymerase [Deltaproteobacteria bacterium]
MARIEIRRRHSLGKERAREMAERLARDLQERLDAQYRWEGDVLRFERSGAKGQLTVGEDEVSLWIELGLVLRPMRSAIEKQIVAYLDDVLR